MVIYENDCFRFEKYDTREEPSFAIISQGDALDAGVTLNLEENYQFLLLVLQEEKCLQVVKIVQVQKVLQEIVINYILIIKKILFVI